MNFEVLLNEPRPFFQSKSPELDSEFERIKNSRKEADIYTLWRLYLELERYRKILKPKGSLTPAGKVRKKVVDRINQLEAERFRWPFTDAPGGDGSLDGRGWKDDSPLFRLGYSAKRGGPTVDERRRILAKAFKGSIPITTDEKISWDEPNSAGRLRKIAEKLAAEIRNRKRMKSRSMESAIQKWQSDLDWLKAEFYDGQSFSFDWPSYQRF